ncbi:hypothetical protein C4F51_05145 [Cellvibrio sp. KB43]|uniref:Sel1 repeat family protein n=2 Tax=Cellvibrio polysaccharolyticus TaxID=2082724 RepID=A0A928V1H4_9GAMM|nr:hypothetical protein [Cellvibrio polysaccharolyticus]
MLKKANKWGSQEARSLLAEIYAVGDFLHRDRNKAIIYYKKIISSRQREVLNIILYHLENQKSEKYDLQEAQFWRSYLIQE